MILYKLQNYICNFLWGKFDKNKSEEALRLENIANIPSQSKQDTLSFLREYLIGNWK